MEQLKSAHRPFKVQNASVNSLTNGCDYYRIRVSSDKKSSGSDNDALYDIQRVFPNNRADLLDGEWHAYLEEFILKGYSQWGHPDWNLAADKDQTDNGIRVCLPDLMKPSKDYIMTSTGIQPDDTLARVPKTLETNTSPHLVLKGQFSGDGNAKIGQITFPTAAGAVVNLVDTVLGQLGVGDAFMVTGHVGAHAAQVNAETVITAKTATQIQFPYNPLHGDGTVATTDINDAVVYVSIPVREGISALDIPRMVGAEVASLEINNALHQPVFKLQQHSGHTFGRAINPTQLFQGQLRVVLRGEDNKPIINVYNDDASLTSIYGYVRNYEATIVFIHRKKY